MGAALVDFPSQFPPIPTIVGSCPKNARPFYRITSDQDLDYFFFSKNTTGSSYIAHHFLHRTCGAGPASSGGRSPAPATAPPGPRAGDDAVDAACRVPPFITAVEPCLSHKFSCLVLGSLHALIISRTFDVLSNNCRAWSVNFLLFTEFATLSVRLSSVQGFWR